MTRLRLSVCVAALMLTLVLSAADAQEVSTPILSISTVPAFEPGPPTAKDYLDAIALVSDLGVNGNVSTFTWSSLEPSEGDYVLDDLPFLRYLSRWHDYRQELGIQVMNTTDKETPPDLLDVPFDDPRMIERFRRLFDAMLPYIDESVLYVSIGNEVDVFLAAYNQWDAYQVFYESAVAYIHEVAPWIQVGVTVTFNGALEHAAEVERLNAMSDVYILTYYPLDDGMMTRGAHSPQTDFPRMVELAGDRPLVLQEVGYPSSELLQSSPDEQAEFFANVFAAWGAHREQIPFLNVFMMHDFTDSFCRELGDYYGIRGNAVFHDFLCTLGLREVDGTPKPAWQVFVDGAESVQ